MVEQHVFGVKGSYEKRSLEEQCNLSLKVKECKDEYLVELESLKGKAHWDSKRKRHIQGLPKLGYLSKVVRNFCSNLKEAKSDSQDMKKTCKFAKQENGDFEDGVAKKSFVLLVVVVKHVI